MAFMPPLLKNRHTIIIQTSFYPSMTHTEKRVHSWFFFPRWFLELNASNVGSFYHASFYARSRYHLESRVNLIMKFQSASFSKKMWDFFWNIFRNISGTFCGSWLFRRHFLGHFLSQFDFLGGLVWHFQGLFHGIFQELFPDFFRDFFWNFPETFPGIFPKTFSWDVSETFPETVNISGTEG